MYAYMHIQTDAPQIKLVFQKHGRESTTGLIHSETHCVAAILLVRNIPDLIRNEPSVELATDATG